MTTTLEVYKGEANENITIDTKDSLSATLDLSWATAGAGESIIEIKDKPGGTIQTTLATTDFVSFNATNVVIKGTKLYALAGGKYFAKFTAQDDAGRIKILVFYVVVRDV